MTQENSEEASDFDQSIVAMREGGRTDKKDEIRAMVDEWPESESTAALHFLSGTYTSAGIGKKSAIKAVQMYDLVDCAEGSSDFEAKVGESGTVTEALRDSEVADVHVDTFGHHLEPTDSGSLDQLQTYIEDVLSNESGDDQIATLGRMLMDFDEPHLVTFALLDDWQTGVTETTIANALGEDVGASKGEIQRARSLEPDPVEFARACAEDRFSDLLVPRPGKPFKPMKAKPESYFPDNTGGWRAEPKLDGYRMLIHVSNGQATAFTRRLKDATESMPELQEIDWPDGEWILDGEAMASDGSYTTTSEMVGSNQERALGDRDEYVTFHTFDVLLWEGIDVSQESYDERRGLLEEMDYTLTAFESDYLDVVPDGTISEMLSYADENDLEGIIAKRPDAEYQFGKRSTAWIKQKNTEVTVDLVMSSFVEGEGSNAGTLGAVELETADGQYVGKMGTGFTDAERDEIWHHEGRYMGGTVEVTFEGLGTNNELRFPRMDRLRLDDGEADDIDRLTDLAEQV